MARLTHYYCCKQVVAGPKGATSYKLKQGMRPGYIVLNTNDKYLADAKDHRAKLLSYHGNVLLPTDQAGDPGWTLQVGAANRDSPPSSLTMMQTDVACRTSSACPA
jgi:hypothetical protein